MRGLGRKGKPSSTWVLLMGDVYKYNPLLKVRVSGFLLEDDALLCVKQRLREWTHWNIPGGTLDSGETLEDCIVREMQEETGLEVKVIELLYVCDRKRDSGREEVDVSFLVRRVGGNLHTCYCGTDGEVLSEVKFVPVRQLTSYGFAPEFQNLIECGLPSRGQHKGDFHALFGRSKKVDSDLTVM